MRLYPNVVILISSVGDSYNDNYVHKLDVDADYVPALGAEAYIDRLSKQLSLSDLVRDKAVDLVDESVRGSSPTIRACCAVLRAAESQGIRLTKSRVASILGVTPVGISMALKRDVLH